MARTTQEIFDIIVAKATAEATAAGNTEVLSMLANTSRVAVWRILFWSIAFATYTVEVIYDAFVEQVLNLLADLIPHSLRWYRKKVLAFQFGFPLLPDSDKYNNTGYTADQIAASKIVKYAAVNEATVNQLRVLLIKIAGADGAGRPTPVTPTQELAIKAYMEEVKDAGNMLLVYNQAADVIRASLNVYYNPLLLDGQGNRLDGGAGKPIEDAANNFPFNLDFNGEFIIAKFIDAIQVAYGVSRSRVDLVLFQKKTGNNAFLNVSSSFIPDAGYAAFDTDGLTINYIADVVG